METSREDIQFMVCVWSLQERSLPYRIAWCPGCQKGGGSLGLDDVGQGEIAERGGFRSACVGAVLGPGWVTTVAAQSGRCFLTFGRPGGSADSILGLYR